MHRIQGKCKQKHVVFFGLFLDLDVLPKSHVITEVFFDGIDGARLGFWVAPGAVLTGLIALDNVKVLADTLPWASIGRVTFF